ncbi:UDP-N-acetylglucosamine--N-acetylmuramyl-(pentapeptide) pyrophosphoryl-undecaprenol N-acetylglucosamine MurG [Scardovia inopinata]|uniref:UDP-N-acetylglucosamine--N-acetylmuramyl-(pentapeptide) pyrophosphoryl-undecaprenol N-acetylglucosamine transferase n=1 Tax=Scardovia inopinata F0304 TaxID=641146 RepID=W5IJY7_SCAIO|nr:UDP-N-acetylglucosamine--N-acetylmuramyl-(pentapeptide) pyrophosphoryl-undecaprenol N-acetylglucosamine transferase [Scardovia inopinata]EFG27328.2 undecaprenyldiphospho-muramoylpentapeptide beta-N-acetylglucosaminyltransferase [Scardovia inopinata F0304]SUV51006.1 UDP-N-acetylglucosamine--N-acetylmuramyl-(pentapeptide) pyrophosphoryl-undecaprenol N-acetylglucosamine MurG [Scardovia inopinata]
MTQPLSIVLAGGGTAGHVNPMLSIADQLSILDPSVKLTVIGTSVGLEARLVPAAGLELETIAKVPFPRKINADAVQFPIRWAREQRRVRQILQEHQANLVVGVGGYASAPAYSMAHKMKLPLVIHEQNARAGMANKLGARWADFVGTVYENTGLKGGAHTVIERVGLPLRKEISDMAARLGENRQAAQAEARRELGLKADKPVVLVTGGSLGALSLNKAVASASTDLLKKAQIIHLTGRGKLDQVAAQVCEQNGSRALSSLSMTETFEGDYHALEYWERMDLAMCASDLVICRSGAGTVAEISALGLPAVYVPLPIGNGEQRLNAQPLAAAGGGLIVADKDFTSRWVKDHIPALLSHPDKLAAMSRAAWNYGVRDAATVMARHILDLALA